MSYLQLRFHVSRDRADALSDILSEIGSLSVTWENAGENEYFEVAYPREPDWRRVYVTGLFRGDCHPDIVMEQVNQGLGTDLVPQVRTLADQDWERSWMTRFEPRRYGGGIWVCPSWTTPPEPGATNVFIDPGLAFGTGDHPTTALCLDWIGEQAWNRRTMVDFGCGSGILAIACLLKGAERAWGVDVDPRARSASALNAARNGVADRYTALPPDGLEDAVQVDVVVANILSNVLIELAGRLTRATLPGGRLLLTGILDHHAERVAAAFRPVFEFEHRAREGWCLLVGTRTGAPPGDDAS